MPHKLSSLVFCRMGYSRFRPLLAAALNPALCNPRDLDLMLASGKAALISTDKAAIVFEVRIYPSGLRDVHGLVAAGDLNDIVETLIPQAEAWGRANGCSGALIESRPGWARILKHHGYEPHQLAVRKEL